MANSVDTDQTIGAVCSGFTLFASILNSSVMIGIICSRRLQNATFSDAFFSWRFKGFNLHVRQAFFVTLHPYIEMVPFVLLYYGITNFSPCQSDLVTLNGKSGMEKYIT